MGSINLTILTIVISKSNKLHNKCSKMSEFIEQIVSSSENFVKINVPDDVNQRFDKVKEEAHEIINSRAFQNLIEISYFIRDVSSFLYEKFIQKNAERLQQQVQQFVEDNRPVLQEVCLFLATWPGPWLFLLQCYISTSLLSFSKYLSKRLEKPETAVVNRALAILANFWNKFANIYHGHQAELVIGINFCVSDWLTIVFAWFGASKHS